MKRLLLCAFLAAELFAPLAAHAHSSVVLGFHFGIPLYAPAPYYYPAPYPYYYYPAPAPYYYPPAYSPAPEAPAPAAAPLAPQWYYCESARGYYPYIRECPGGWQSVPASPPPAR